MNTNWMKCYAVIIDGEYIDCTRYLVWLGDNAITRERKRIAKQSKASWKNVQLVRVHD
jgi:hypothetical protein